MNITLLVGAYLCLSAAVTHAQTVVAPDSQIIANEIENEIEKVQVKPQDQNGEFFHHQPEINTSSFNENGSLEDLGICYKQCQIIDGKKYCWIACPQGTVQE